ncbi:MAG: nuclear transport factor 2 family protein [Armatimonadota bacterium]
MQIRTASCVLVLAALILCGWVVFAQEEDPEVAGLRTVTKQLAEAMERGDRQAIGDFMGDNVLVVVGMSGESEYLTKEELLDQIATVTALEVDDESFDVLVMGMAGSVRCALSVTAGGETLVAKADLLFAREGGEWVWQAAAVGPVEE